MGNWILKIIPVLLFSGAAVADDRIVYIGDPDGAQAWRGTATQVIDLRGQSGHNFYRAV